MKTDHVSALAVIMQEAAKKGGMQEKIQGDQKVAKLKLLIYPSKRDMPVDPVLFSCLPSVKKWLG